ncbi:MAG: NADP-dependent oxidoreductase [Acidobacteria bacterium]|nr:MAG: NADP-dependent oxidoreductase [Acidobacteriota bacterium]REK07724.1 MAG: NADP-dependent oxidoreductase [Acidobacteriota bacterium]
MSERNTQVLLRTRPEGKLSPDHFEIRQVAMPEAADGEVVVRSVLLSLDAANRAWMQGATYKSAVEEGDVMHGYAIGEVVTGGERFEPGDLVAGELGWQQYAAMREKALQRMPDHRPISHLHSLLGIAGKTAYHGLLNVAGIEAEETLLVSAAAGSVGSIVGQIGRIRGAHVVGIAGGAEKCAWVRDELGFHACIDYKNDDVAEAIRRHCPNGVDVYFDNVGGPILQAALFAMNLRGRIACCGAVSQYDTAEPRSPAGIPGLLVVKRLRMEGFIVMDFADRDDEAQRDLLEWSRSGELRVAEDVLEGIESAPAGLVGLLAGENRGKRMVRVGPDPA